MNAVQDAVWDKGIEQVDMPVTPLRMWTWLQEHKQAGFLARNGFGQVPVLEDGGSTIADSNAILVYLAKRYDDGNTWLPADPLLAAEVQRFLSS